MTHDQEIRTTSGNGKTVSMFRVTSIGLRRDRNGDYARPKILGYTIEVRYADRPELDFSEWREKKEMANACYKTWATLTKPN